MRRLPILSLACSLSLAGCLGPMALHEAVLRYDDPVSRLESEMLLLNIARTHHQVPTHFTVTSSIAATFDYRANPGLSSSLFRPGRNAYGFSLGASAAENPTLSIVPVLGEDFTRRILTPREESKFEFLAFQGAPIDMVMRLMADGIEVQNRDGTFQRFILNWPTQPKEYEEFRRLAMHLAWLNANRQLFVGPLSGEESAGSPAPGPPAASVRPGRVAVTNYDPRRLGRAERQALDARAAANPRNFVLVDVQPGHPGGDFPLFGGIKLRSLNTIIAFVASGIGRTSEYEVAKDPRTGQVARNPTRALAVEEREAPPAEDLPRAVFKGKAYSVANTPWDREAFTLLHHLFQMTVTDVSRVGVPITISK